MPSARKFKLKLSANKPRNPLVIAALTRKAGKHQESEKARRQRAQRELRRALKHKD